MLARVSCVVQAALRVGPRLPRAYDHTMARRSTCAVLVLVGSVNVAVRVTVAVTVRRRPSL